MLPGSRRVALWISRSTSTLKEAIGREVLLELFQGDHLYPASRSFLEPLEQNRPILLVLEPLQRLPPGGHERLPGRQWDDGVGSLALGVDHVPHVSKRFRYRHQWTSSSPGEIDGRAPSRPYRDTNASRAASPHRTRSRRPFRGWTPHSPFPLSPTARPSPGREGF